MALAYGTLLGGACLAGLFGGVSISWQTPGGVTVALPLVVPVAALLVAAELVRGAHWRSRVAAATDRRLLLFGGVFRWRLRRERPLADALEWHDDRLLLFGDGAWRLQGLPWVARCELSRVLGLPEPPRPPTGSWRRLAASAWLLLTLGVVAAAGLEVWAWRDRAARAAFRAQRDDVDRALSRALGRLDARLSRDAAARARWAEDPDDRQRRVNALRWELGSSPRNAFVERPSWQLLESRSTWAVLRALRVGDLREDVRVEALVTLRRPWGLIPRDPEPVLIEGEGRPDDAIFAELLGEELEAAGLDYRVAEPD